MSCSTSLQKSQENLSSARNSINLQKSERRSKRGKKLPQVEPFQSYERAITVMCEDSFHQNEMATKLDFGIKDGATTLADCNHKIETTPETGCVHKDKFALPADCENKNAISTKIDFVHQAEVAAPSDFVCKSDTPTETNSLHKDEFRSYTENLQREYISFDVRGKTVTCPNNFQISKTAHVARRDIHQTQLMERIPSTNVRKEDVHKFTTLDNFAPAECGAPVGSILNAGGNEATLPPVVPEGKEIVGPSNTALTGETFNLDDLICLNDEMAAKIAHLVQDSFNLGNLLLEALRRKKITNVMDSLEHSVVRIMARVAKKYLEMNKSTLLKNIQMNAIPIMKMTTDPEPKSPAIIPEEINLPLERLSTNHNSCNHYSSKKGAGGYKHRNSPRGTINPCANDLDCFQMNESEFDVCEAHRPSASTPKSSLLNPHQISFNPENSEIEFENYQTLATESPNMGIIADVEPGVKQNVFFEDHHPRVAPSGHFLTSVNPSNYNPKCTTNQSEPQTYGVFPVRKVTPVMTKVFHEQDRRFSERAINRLQSCNEQKWGPNARHSLDQFSWYDNRGIIDANSPYTGSQFQMNQRSDNHLLANANMCNNFASFDQARNGNFLPNQYSSDFHSPLLSPYPAHSQQPLLYHPVAHTVPTFQTPYENVGGRFRNAFQPKINGSGFAANSTNNPPPFHNNDHQTYPSNENFVYPNHHYPREQDGNYFREPKDIPDIFFREMECRTRSNIIPEEVPNNYAHFRSTFVPSMSNFNKPCVRSSISVMRERDEDYEELCKHSGEVPNQVSSRQSEPFMVEADSIDAIYPYNVTEDNANERKGLLPENCHASFSVDSLNFTIKSRDVFKIVANNETVNSSWLSNAWAPSNETITDSSSSSLYSDFHCESSLKKTNSQRNLKTNRFPLLCGEFFNRYDAGNRNPAKQNATSAIDLPLSPNKNPSRLCTSSLPYELQTNFFGSRAETKVHGQSNCDFKYPQTRCGSTKSQFNLDSLSTENFDMDYSSSDVFRESSKNLDLCNQKMSMVEINCNFNSSPLSKLSRKEINYFNFDADLPNPYELNVHTNSSPHPTNALSSMTNFNFNPVRDSKISPKKSTKSVACQTVNWNFVHEREKCNLKGSPEFFCEIYSLREHCSCTDSSHTCFSYAAPVEENFYNCSKPTGSKHTQKLRFIGHNFGNQACLNFHTLKALLKPCPCSLCLKLCDSINRPICDECSECLNGHRNSRKCCENFKNRECHNFRYFQRCCNKPFQRRCNRSCMKFCCHTENCQSFKKAKPCFSDFSCKRFVESSSCVADCSCSYFTKNKVNVCRVHCKKVPCGRAFGDYSCCRRVCIRQNPSTICDYKSQTCKNERMIAHCTSDKPKSSKSLFTMNQSREQTSLLKTKYEEISQMINKESLGNFQFLTGSLPDYCKMKRKLLMHTSSHVNAKCSNVAKNCPSEVCKSTEMEDSSLRVPLYRHDYNYSNILAEVNQYNHGKSLLTVRVNSELKSCIDVKSTTKECLRKPCICEADSEPNEASNGSLLSAVELSIEESCNSRAPKIGAISVNYAHPPLDESLEVAHDLVGIGSLTPNGRTVDNYDKFTVLDKYMNSGDKVFETKCNETVQATCIEKNTVRKLVAIFEGLSRGHL